MNEYNKEKAMPVEKSAGIIFFRNTPEGRRYLVIRSSRSGRRGREHWDFPKGRLEKGEQGIDAARREAKEESGIEDFKIIPEFKKTIQYFTRREEKTMRKFVALFLAEAKTDEVKLSWEHDKYEWLPYEGAYTRLSHPEFKQALEAAEQFLKS